MSSHVFTLSSHIFIIKKLSLTNGNAEKIFKFLDPIHDIEDDRNNRNVSIIIKKKFIMTRLSIVFYRH